MMPSYNLKTLVLVVGVLVTAISAGSNLGQQCPVKKNSLVRLSINSHRNETGHWQSQIGFEPGSDWKVNQTESWSLDVDQSTSTSCDGEEGFSIIATLSHGPKISHSRQHIPEGYELFPNVGYYKYHSKSVIWSRARQVCAEEGAHLVIVNSESEANVLRQYFDLFPKEKITEPDASDTIWIGAYEQGGNYYTIYGELLNTTGFKRWHPGQPADAGTNDCLSLYRQQAGIDDVPCIRKATFVCELPSK